MSENPTGRTATTTERLDMLRLKIDVLRIELARMVWHQHEANKALVDSLTHTINLSLARLKDLTGEDY